MTAEQSSPTVTDERLAELPAADLPQLDAERARLRAQRVLKTELALRDRPWARTFDRVWVRRLEPALLAGSSAYYLVWALLTCSVAAR